MVETIHFSRILTEDLDIGMGTREVRLADNSLQTLRQINIGTLLLTKTARFTPTDTQVQDSVSVILAGARIFGVTIKVITELGNGNSLTTFSIGDATLEDRWGQGIARTANTETSQANFRYADLPIYTSDTNVLITADSGTFDGTGELEVTAHYITLSHTGL